MLFLSHQFFENALSFKIFNQYIKIILYNVLAVIVLFLLAEVAVRIFFPEVSTLGTDSVLIMDSVYNDSPGLRQNASGYSNQGLKTSDENGYLKYKGNAAVNEKWLLLGDSVTMGIGVDDEDTFAALLQIANPNVKILNPSLIGYSAKDYYNVVSTLKSDTAITRVFIMWCLNDTYSGELVQDSPEAGRSFFSGILKLLRNYSKLYIWLKGSFTDRQKAYFEYDKSYYTEDNKNFIEAAEYIRKIDSVVVSAGKKLTVIILPYEYQTRKKIEDYRPQETLKKFISGLNIQIFDIRFSGQADDYKKYYLFGDGIHFSKEGHKKIFKEFENILNQ